MRCYSLCNINKAYKELKQLLHHRKSGPPPPTGECYFKRCFDKLNMTKNRHSERNEMQSKNLKRAYTIREIWPQAVTLRVSTSSRWPRIASQWYFANAKWYSACAEWYLPFGKWYAHPRACRDGSYYRIWLRRKCEGAMRKKNLRISIAIKRLDASKRKKLRIYRGRILAVCNRRKKRYLITNT